MSRARSLVVALLAGAAVAQGPARKPLVGRVHGQGAPVAGAAVTLLGFGSHFDPRRDAADTVQVRADARGHFHALVLPGLPYLGHACGEPTATGAVARSRVQGWYGAGAVCEFECAAPDGPFVVQLRGIEAWADSGPLSLVARPAIASGGGALPCSLPVAVDGEGRAIWPAIPPGVWELRTAAGVPVLVQSMLLAAESTLAVLPPRAVSCRVADAVGAPIAAAEIWLRGSGFVDDGIDGVQTMRCRDEYRIATTAADGMADLQLPIEDPLAVGSSVNVLLSARAAGRAERVSGYQGRLWYRDDQRIQADGERVLSFSLPATAPARGAVRFGSAPAGSGAMVRLQVVAKLHGGGRSFTHDARVYEGAVAADGTFAIDGVPDDVYATRAVLLQGDGGLPISMWPARGRGQEVVLDLAAATVLRLSVLDARHGPAAGHVVYLRQLTAPAEPLVGTTSRWCVDAAGRAELRLWPGDWFVFAADDEACGWQRVQLAAGAQHGLELRLEQYPVVRGVLTDDDGAPVAGALVELRNTAVERIDDQDDGIARSFLRAQAARLLRAASTAADGSFAIPYPPVRGLRLNVQMVGNGRRSERFDLLERDAPLRLRWQ